MDNRFKSKFSASLSLSPTTHSYANMQAPNLNLTRISHHTDPITIYADELSPTLMLTCGACIISSLTNGSEFKQSRSTHCRIPPPSKVPVTLNKRLFHTLLPNTPLTLSAPFTRSRTSTGGKPLAKNDPDSTSDHIAKHGACGVDGLEPGHDYVLNLASNPPVSWDIVRWWEYGTKEHVLHAEGDESQSDGTAVKSGPGPHDAVMVGSTSIRAIAFQCQEFFRNKGE